jgi:hypothetical protein
MCWFESSPGHHKKVLHEVRDFSFVRLAKLALLSGQMKNHRESESNQDFLIVAPSQDIWITESNPVLVT